MAGWAAVSLEDLPQADEDELGPAWYPLQHAFGLTAFGANAFVAGAAGEELVSAHDERGSGQEELYVVIRGRARFTLDGESVDAPAITVVGVPGPTVSRRAEALEPGTTLLAFGGERREDFRSTWRPAHFEGVPRVL